MIAYVVITAPLLAAFLKGFVPASIKGFQDGWHCNAPDCGYENQTCDCP